MSVCPIICLLKIHVLWSKGLFAMTELLGMINSDASRKVIKSVFGVLNGREVIKLFSCSAQLRLKFILLIKMLAF